MPTAGWHCLVLNAVELMVKTFLSPDLPKRVTGLNISRKEFEEICQSFPRLLDALKRYASDRLAGVDLDEIGYYHQLRKRLYHGVDPLVPVRNMVEVHAELAKLLFRNLFDHEIEPAEDNSHTALSEFMSAWMKLDRELRELTRSERDNQLRALAEKGLVDNETMRRLFQFRDLRNQIVHGEVDYREALRPQDTRAINEITRKVKSVHGELYRPFFEALIDELRERRAFPDKAAQPRSFCCFASGFPGILYCASFALGNRVRAEIYIDVKNKDRNKKVFDQLHSASAQIEAQLGESLTWERLNAKKASRIALYTWGSISISAEELAKVRGWFVDRLPKLKKVFEPRLGEALR